MAILTDVIFDTAFLTETLHYLSTSHGITAYLTDSNGASYNEAGEKIGEISGVQQYFPFEYSSDIGGLTCVAGTPAALEQAATHIEFCLKGLVNQLHREEEIKLTGDEMLELSAQLSFLNSLTQKVIGIKKLQDFCKVILTEIAKAIKADSGFLASTCEGCEDVRLFYQMEMERVSAVENDSAFQEIGKDNTVLFTLSGGASALLTPINAKGGTVGYMVFMRQPENNFFTAYEKKFVGIIEQIISPTIEALRLYDNLQELYLNTVKALAAAIDAKDEYTHGHSFRVAKYSVAIGKQLNIPENNLTDLEVAAYMHDLGKIGVSEAILSKPGRLTDEEFDAIKTHPGLTSKILEPIHLPDFILNAAVQHHERLDGSGYPFGLAGSNISLYARIISVADVFDAVTSARPYRQAMSVEKGLKILCEGVDKEFDRTIVLALIQALHNEEIHQEITQISPDLIFVDIQEFNHFLRELLEVIVPQTASLDSVQKSMLQEISREISTMGADSLFEKKKERQQSG